MKTRLQVEQWECISGYNKALQMLDCCPVNTKHIRVCNKETVLSLIISKKYLLQPTEMLMSFSQLTSILICYTDTGRS